VLSRLCWLRQESQQVLWVHGRQSQIELKTARRSARPQLWTSARAKIDCKLRERSPFYDGKLEDGKDREVAAIRQVSHNVRDIELMSLFSSGRVGTRWRLTEVIIYRGLTVGRAKKSGRTRRKKKKLVRGAQLTLRLTTPKIGLEGSRLQLSIKEA
jgi:hypothetical protein